MPEWVYDAFSYFVMAYSAIILGSYVFFAILAFLEHKKHYTYHDDDYTIEELKKSPYTPPRATTPPSSGSPWWTR